MKLAFPGRRSLVGLFSFVGLGALLVACTVDAKKLEDSIRTEMKSKGVEMKSISCPTGQKSFGTNKFDCTGETNDGEKVVFNANTQGGGAVAWELKGKIIPGTELEDMIKEKADHPIKVKCRMKVMIFNEGDVFFCDETVEGKKFALQVKAKNDSGLFEWKAATNDDGEKMKKADGDDDDDKAKSKDDDDDKKKKKSKDDDDDKKKKKSKDDD